MRMWRCFLLVVFMLWLPMRGFAAVAMPFCMHALGDSDGVQMNVAHHDHTHHKHLDHSPLPAYTHYHQGHTTGLLCNECGACHLACAPLAPCVTVSFVVPCGHTFGDLPPASPSLFVPEQLERPPLSAIV